MPGMKSPLALVLAAATLASPSAVRAADRTSPPAWAADAVWYQIFPERFRNGDPKNDPTPADIAGSWPHEAPAAGWRPHPWTSDWFKLQPWETLGDRKFYYNAQLRRYGGDLQGVLDRLDYLKRLGVTAIYLNPIFESPSLHKYDATFYHHVDNNFGPDPAGDRAVWAKENPADPSTWQWTSADRLFLTLVAECHKRGIRVVIDGVFNHTGMTFWAFEDVRRRGAASPYKDWYDVKSFDDPATPADELTYRSWFNVPELPELRDEGDTLAEGPREHIRAIVRRWMDPNGDGRPDDGIDGWRLDAADTVGHGFWRDFRSWVLAVNPDAYITAELFWEDHPHNKIYDAEPWLRGDQFDAVMNYRWAVEVKAFFVDRRTAITATELDRRLEALRRDYREETNYALQNLVDSHDTDRLASMIVNPDRLYDHKISPTDDPTYDVRAPTPSERRRQLLVATFQFAYLGAPMVYYGDEAGMWGADDPDERKPMVWDDMRYETEASHPFGLKRPADPVRFERDVFDRYAALARIRNASPALRRGTLKTVILDDERRLFGFAREGGGQRVVAVFNASERPQEVELLEPGGRDLLTKRVYRARGGRVRFTLPALGAAIVEVTKPDRR
jgi:glycosidase